MAREGEYTDKYIPVNSDSMDILTRLKEIDDSYFVLMNRATEKFEIHSSRQAGDSLCLILPGRFLDASCLSYVRKYRRERMKEIIEEMDRENEKLERRQAAQARDSLGSAVDDALRRLQ